MGAWAIKKLGGNYTAVRVERGTPYTQQTAHYTIHTAFFKNANLGEYAGICIEVQLLVRTCRPGRRLVMADGM